MDLLRDAETKPSGLLGALFASAAALLASGCGNDESADPTSAMLASSRSAQSDLMGGKAHGQTVDPTQLDGQQVFRFDTFGDESFWTDTLRLNEAIEAALDPVTALSLGLQVDAEALPPGILETADLNAPATTVALIGLNAVLGVRGEVDSAGNLVRVGVTCALCHSRVDDSVMPGIGQRLDGFANRALDPGAIIALAPALADEAEQLAVLRSWGPGRYDARWNQDGINAPVLIPPIYGLEGVPLETYTGDGPISYWNAYVGTTQMGGQGQFFDPRISVAVFHQPDRLTPKLPALYAYQVSLAAPAPVQDSFDAAAAERGRALFEGAGRCAGCHSGALRTDVTEYVLHEPAETGMDPLHAERSATHHYRTTPLRGLQQHPPYFHDGSAATLEEVVEHYQRALDLSLDADQRADLVEYLRSL
ncbi:MAG TPA: c-type cytochrome [Polyangiaceae bacterium]|nr:c-type cytochrome [Polyangiaceae bacterium]